MNKSKMLKVLNIIMIVLLAGGCFCFYNLYRKAESELKNTMTKLNNTTTGVEINIGTPYALGGTILNTVTSLEDRNIIIRALIDATTVDKPEITNEAPDNKIIISNSGMIYYTINLWQDNDKVIFDLGDAYEKRYKELSINSKYILEVISKYIPNN